jgi:hypothetical protein
MSELGQAPGQVLFLSESGAQIGVGRVRVVVGQSAQAPRNKRHFAGEEEVAAAAEVRLACVADKNGLEQAFLLRRKKKLKPGRVFRPKGIVSRKFDMLFYWCRWMDKKKFSAPFLLYPFL